MLKVITYNIWFDDYEKEKRTISLYKTISKHNPDIICLQEVTPKVYDLLKMLFDNYNYIYPEELDQSYDCVIFSKHKIITKYKKKYNGSRMGRSLTAINIEYLIENKKINFTVATSHFESLFGFDNQEKLTQYSYAKNILDKLYDEKCPIILCCDTNIMQKEENYFFNDGKWVDCYKTNKNTKDKNIYLFDDKYEPKDDDLDSIYTYDTVTNRNLMKRNIYQIRSRIDRILYKSQQLIKPIEYKIIKGDSKEIEPSDHYGIMVSFKINLSYLDKLNEMENITVEI